MHALCRADPMHQAALASGRSMRAMARGPTKPPDAFAALQAGGQRPHLSPGARLRRSRDAATTLTSAAVTEAAGRPEGLNDGPPPSAPLVSELMRRSSPLAPAATTCVPLAIEGRAFRQGLRQTQHGARGNDAGAMRDSSAAAAMAHTTEGLTILHSRQCPLQAPPRRPIRPQWTRYSMRVILDHF